MVVHVDVHTVHVVLTVLAALAKLNDDALELNDDAAELNGHATKPNDEQSNVHATTTWHGYGWPPNEPLLVVSPGTTHSAFNLGLDDANGWTTSQCC